MTHMIRYSDYVLLLNWSSDVTVTKCINVMMNLMTLIGLFTFTFVESGIRKIVMVLFVQIRPRCKTSEFCTCAIERHFLITISTRVNQILNVIFFNGIFQADIVTVSITTRLNVHHLVKEVVKNQRFS